MSSQGVFRDMIPVSYLTDQLLNNSAQINAQPHRRATTANALFATDFQKRLHTPAEITRICFHNSNTTPSMASQTTIASSKA